VKNKGIFKLLGAIALAVVIAITFVPGCAKAPAPVPGPAPAPAPEVINLKLQTTMGPAELYRISPLVDHINAAGKGRVHIELFLMDELVPFGEELVGTSTGVVDMCHGSGPFYSDIIPVTAFEFGFPFQYEFPGAFDPHILLYDFGLIDTLREAYATQGCYYVGPFGLDVLELASREEAHSIADLQKLKIACKHNEAMMFEKCGIASTAVEFPELTTALGTGVIDATIDLGARPYMDYGFADVTSYLILPTYVPNTLQNWIFNLDKWNSLPSDVQALIELSVKWYSYWDASNMWKEEYEGRKEMVEAGMEIIYLDDDAVQTLREASSEAMEEWSHKNARCAHWYEVQTYWASLVAGS